LAWVSKSRFGSTPFFYWAVKLAGILMGSIKMKEMIIVADENKFDVAWLRLSERGINNG